MRGGHDDGGGLLHLHPQGPPKEPPGEGPLTPSRPASPHPPPALVDAADEGTPRAVEANPQLRGPQALVEGDLSGRKREREGGVLGEAAPELIVNLYSLRLPRGARSTSSSVSFRSQRTRQSAGRGRRNTTKRCPNLCLRERRARGPPSSGAREPRPGTRAYLRGRGRGRPPTFPAAYLAWRATWAHEDPTGERNAGPRFPSRRLARSSRRPPRPRMFSIPWPRTLANGRGFCATSTGMAARGSYLRCMYQRPLGSGEKRSMSGTRIA